MKHTNVEKLKLLLKEEQSLVCEKDLDDLYDLGYKDGFNYRRNKNVENFLESLKENAGKIFGEACVVAVCALILYIPYKWIYLENCEVYKQYDQAVIACSKGDFDTCLSAYYKCSQEWFIYPASANRQEQLKVTYQSSGKATKPFPKTE